MKASGALLVASFGVVAVMLWLARRRALEAPQALYIETATAGIRG